MSLNFTNVSVRHHSLQKSEPNGVTSRRKFPTYNNVRSGVNIEVLDHKGKRFFPLKSRLLRKKSLVCFFAESIGLNCTTLSQTVRNWRDTTKNSVFSLLPVRSVRCIEARSRICFRLWLLVLLLFIYRNLASTKKCCKPQRRRLNKITVTCVEGEYATLEPARSYHL